MPGYPPRRSLGALENINDWMEQRRADLRHLEQDARAAGHDVWSRATRAGQNIIAQTPAQVRAIGARAIDAEQARPSRTAAHPASKSVAKVPAAGMRNAWLSSAKDQSLAALRGAQDAFTMGFGDKAYVTVGALNDAAHGEDLVGSWHTRMERERARDAYDRQHYGKARVVGEVLGTGAQLAALGPLESVVPVGARIAQATKLLWNEKGAIAGAGALGGAGTQIISDELTGHRSSPRELVASAVGGTAGALTSIGGSARRAGAVDGAVTSAVQDVLHGHMPSVERAAEAASVGGTLGAVAGRVGRSWSNGLDNRAKGKLGEFLSQFRTAARGGHTEPWSWSPEYLPSGRKTIPDSRSYRGDSPGEIIESKFGRGIKPLQGGQREAWEVLPNYRVDHWRPEDLGVMLGFPSFAFGEAFKTSNNPSSDQ